MTIHTVLPTYNLNGMFYEGMGVIREI